jgi:TPR repeat protein
MSRAVILTRMSGPADGRVLRIKARGEPAQIHFGRMATCEVALADDPDISRVHARLFWSDSGWLIEDLKSTNGTFVGEFQGAQRVDGTMALQPGSIFRVGLTRFRLNRPEKTTGGQHADVEAPAAKSLLKTSVVEPRAGVAGLPTEQAVSRYRKWKDAGVFSGRRYEYQFGLMYENGEPPFTKNDATAAHWYLKAANAGDDISMACLANMYERGKGGLPRDDVQASIWYERVANVSEMVRVAEMYEEGRDGMPRDLRRANSWYRRAAEAGNTAGMCHLGHMYTRTWDWGKREDISQAIIWYRKAADAGDASGMFHLGLLFENGRPSLSKDVGQAASWYRKAAQLGNASAQEALKRLGK